MFAALALAVSTASPPPADPPTQPATHGAQHAKGDPLEGLNRRFFKFNDGLDRAIFGPTARAYKRKAPPALQRLLHNFVDNFSEPTVIINDALQLRPKRTVTAAFRFVVNTTVGVAGLFDVAKKAGAEHHDNDFGITLGRWGVPAGPYLYVPFMGPSSARDAFGSAVDGFVLDPLNWAGYSHDRVVPKPPRKPFIHKEDEIPHRATIRVGESAFDMIDTRARVDDDINAIMSTATDPYATFRSLYLQNRAAQVSQSMWRHDTVPDFQTPADTPPMPEDGGPKPASDPGAAPATPPPAAAPDPGAAPAPPAAPAVEPAPPKTDASAPQAAPQPEPPANPPPPPDPKTPGA